MRRDADPPPVPPLDAAIAIAGVQMGDEIGDDQDLAMSRGVTRWSLKHCSMA
jgi:hypothetical protein